MVTVPSPREVGPEYCHRLARTWLMVYGLGSWFFQTRVSPCGVTCTSPYTGFTGAPQVPCMLSVAGDSSVSHTVTTCGVNSAAVGLAVGGGGVRLAAAVALAAGVELAAAVLLAAGVAEA